ncbi:MAG: FAD-dependent oxidoreductase [Elusimicrobia bacterium]|nr:FAD-dependent oxidoreductase [Elusimicrobiota bacterium]
MALTRRSFIRWVISAGAAMACPVPGWARGSGQTPGGRPKTRLDSEANEICHQSRDGLAMPVPAPSLSCDILIVGGGPSGLAAADELKDQDFLLLEKEPYLGGNSYTESWQGLNYSTGAAWDSSSDPSFAALVKRWNFDWKPIKGEDSVCYDGVWIRDFWNGRADNPAFDKLPYPKAVKDSFRQFLRDIEKIDTEKQMESLDARPFSDFLEGYSPQLQAFWDCFGPSNWGATSRHTSAYLGLQAAKDWFRTQRYTWEGGIGVASQIVWRGLPEKAKKRALTGATVYRLARQKGRVWATFMHEGKPRTVEARAAVVAAPKYIARRLVDRLPADQAAAMSAMRYAPYMVYNLCFDRMVYNRSYDNWVVGARNFTDFIPADWVTHGDGGDPARKQVITVYAPRPEQERPELLDDELVLHAAEQAVSELVSLFPDWERQLSEVRIFRRGHPLPMSVPGYATRLQPLASRDLPPIYFGHSDSAGEVSDFFYAALNGISAARKTLKHL